MQWFLWPGEKICDLLRLQAPDDRQAFRIFANMIVWGAIIVLVALALT